MNQSTSFLPLLSNNVSGYAVRPESIKFSTLDRSMACASFAVTTPTGAVLSVELYFPTDAAPLPVAYGRNGCDGGELRFESGWQADGSGKRAARTELTDFDGAGCLPKSVCVVLRAHGLTVSDDCLSSPL